MTIPRNVVSAEGSPSFLLLVINKVPYDESAPLRLADGDWHGQRVLQIVEADFLKASKVAIAQLPRWTKLPLSTPVYRGCNEVAVQIDPCVALIGTITLPAASC